MSYRMLRDDVAAAMEPAEAQALDELMVAETDAHARQTAAELASCHPTQAARLLHAYQNAGDEAAEQRAWDALLDAWERCLTWHWHGPEMAIVAPLLDMDIDLVRC